MTYGELCEAILTAQEEMLKCKIDANSVTLNGRRYGKLIENCPPNMKPTIFGMTVKADYALPDDYDFLVQYEPPHPQTNDFIPREVAREKLCSMCRYEGTDNCSECEHPIDDIPAADVAPGSDFRDCRNELCLRCGQYKTKHLGYCDGCRWRH